MTDDLIEQAEALCRQLENGELHWQAYKQIMPQLVAEIKRLQAQVENCHAAKNLHARRSEKLQEQLVAKDDLLAQNQITIQMHHRNVLELQKELATWQKIAIDEHTKYLAASHCTTLVVHSDAIEGTMRMIEDHIPVFREQAAKELNLQVAQEAGYAERLEKEFLDVYPYAEIGWSMHGYPIEFSEEERQTAQAALEKIRGVSKT